MNTDRLAAYLRAAERGGFGWRSRYNDGINTNPDYLAGHYEGMLGDLIKIMGGPRAVLDLIAARSRCERAAPEEEGR